MKSFAAFLSCVALLAGRGQAQPVLSTLALFNNTNGMSVLAPMTQGGDQNFYGTTYQGGTNGGWGTVFKLSTNGTLTSLVSFNKTNGANPQAGLTLGRDGSFYGATVNGGTNGGYGLVFKVTTNGVLNTLATFNSTNGAYPRGSLTLAGDGNFYGTTGSGGTNGGYGTIFKITTNGVLTSLFSFNNTNGATPDGALAPDGLGNFYGTTYYGGTNGGYGTVFKVTTNGVMTSLVSFNSTNGSYPYAGLTLGRDGNLYGSTFQGGTNGSSGTLFRVTTNGALTSLISLGRTNGSYPMGDLVQGTDGNFYGTAYFGGNTNLNSGNGYGLVFSLTTNGALTPLISFNNTNGASPRTGLTQGRDGYWYGTTYSGTNGYGTVFKLAVGSPGVILNLQSLGGKWVLTWSNSTYSLLSATNVTGSYTAVSGATSPYTNSLGGTKRFFRLVGN